LTPVVTLVAERVLCGLWVRATRTCDPLSHALTAARHGCCTPHMQGQAQMLYTSISRVSIRGEPSPGGWAHPYLQHSANEHSEGGGRKGGREQECLSTAHTSLHVPAPEFCTEMTDDRQQEGRHKQAPAHQPGVASSASLPIGTQCILTLALQTTLHDSMQRARRAAGSRGAAKSVAWTSTPPMPAARCSGWRGKRHGRTAWQRVSARTLLRPLSAQQTHTHGAGSPDGSIGCGAGGGGRLWGAET